MDFERDRYDDLLHDEPDRDRRQRQRTGVSPGKITRTSRLARRANSHGPTAAPLDHATSEGALDGGGDRVAEASESGHDGVAVPAVWAQHGLDTSAAAASAPVQAKAKDKGGGEDDKKDHEGNGAIVGAVVGAVAGAAAGALIGAAVGPPTRPRTSTRCTTGRSSGRAR